MLTLRLFLIALLFPACGARPDANDPANPGSSSPATIEVRAMKLLAAEDLFCAVDNADNKWCWGRDEGLLAKPPSAGASHNPADDDRWQPALDVRKSLRDRLMGEKVGARDAAAVPERVSSSGGFDEWWGCSVDAAGSVQCRSEDAPVEGLPAVERITVGKYQDRIDDVIACAWNPGEKVYCWGSPRSYAFVQSERPKSMGSWVEPREVVAHQGAMEVAIDGTGRICSLDADRKVKCTGRFRTQAPQKVPLEDVVAVEDFFLALTRDGQAHHWGYNSSWGKLLSRPRSLPDMGKVVEINGVSGKKQDGSLLYASRKPDWQPLSVKLMPGERLGQSGSGCFTLAGPKGLRMTVDLNVGRDGVQLVENTSNATDAYCDVPYGACALLENGDLVCSNRGKPAERIAKLSPAKLFSGGLSRGCIVRPTGRVECWASKELEPTPMPGPEDVVHLESGFSTGCAIERDGDLWCWGDALGKRAAFKDPTPRRMEGLNQVVDLALTNDTTCALQSDGQLFCWGSAEEGALGNGMGLTDPVAIRFTR